MLTLSMNTVTCCRRNPLLTFYANADANVTCEQGFSGPAHGLVTKTVHKTLPGGGGGRGIGVLFLYSLQSSTQ